jgi:hypothetical protein
MTGFDLTESIVPKSDQLNAEDLLTGPRTFTITEVRKGSLEQPVDIHLAEFPGRPFRPSKTVRRILVAAWGPDAATYAGRRMTLYRDPAVRFGGQDVGGIRVSHLSHIAKPMTLALTVSKGKRAPYVVQPLADSPPPPPRSAPAGDSITPEQLTALNVALANDMGLADRDDKLAYLSGELGREVGSSKEITRDEASRLLDRIKAWAEPSETTPEPPLGEGGAR